jgi:phosphomannomutase
VGNLDSKGAIVLLREHCDRVNEVVKRDDIRGVYGKDIDCAFARRLGRALAVTFRQATAVLPVNVVVGHDMRLSGPALAEAVADGLEAGGCRAIRMGLAGTELVGFLPAHYSDVIDGGVMITASHNPADNNGFKFFGRCGQPLPLARDFVPPLPEDELLRVALAVKKSSIPRHLGWKDFAPDYIRTAIEKGSLDLARAAQGASAPLRVAVEAGNGMGAVIAREVAALTPEFSWTFSNATPDGRFPKIVPNPLKPEYQAMVAELVRKSGAHVGLCFDGDADRVALADENGEMVSPPLLATLVGMRLREKLGVAEKIAHNLSSSWVVADTLGDRNNVTGDGPTVISAVGYSKIKVLLHNRPDIAFAAEHSGHYMFRDFYCADSGMLAALIMLEVAAELHARGEPLSSALTGLRGRYYESGELNFRLPEGRSVEGLIAQAVEAFRDEAVNIYATGEGGVEKIDTYPPPFAQAGADVRFEAKDWWFVMRASGTESICRLCIEADADRALMERKRDALVRIIGPELQI